ncbi:MAG TPA: hypothetical protein DCZ95_08210 [Verrucomicrobia bacterium]|nr:hypothetical protein [Verrucomicrobiota bacterium]
MFSKKCRILVILPVLTAALLTGCHTAPKTVIPLNDAQLRAFFSKAQDPRRFWITVYKSDEGDRFTGACRLHPEQAAHLKFESGRHSLAPMIAFKDSAGKSYKALIDTSSSFSWLTFETAKKMQMIPLGPPAYDLIPQHVNEDIPGYACTASRIVFDQVYMETPLFYTRSALGPLGTLSRDQISPLPDAVLGCNMLKAFTFVQINYPTRHVALSSTFEYAPGTNLVATVPLREIKGAIAVMGSMDGKPTSFILDTAGDYAIALDPAPEEPIRQVSLGDLVFRQVQAVSSQEKGLGMRDVPRIGNRLLGKLNLTFDYKNRVVYFEKP